MSAAGGEKRKTLEKWAFRGVCPSSFDIFSWVHQGDTISEIIDKGGYF